MIYNDEVPRNLRNAGIGGERVGDLFCNGRKKVPGLEQYSYGVASHFGSYGEEMRRLRLELPLRRRFLVDFRDDGSVGNVAFCCDGYAAG